MLVIITAEICLPYCVLSEIDILQMLILSTHLKTVFSDMDYSFTSLEYSSNVVLWATFRLSRAKYSPELPGFL